MAVVERDPLEKAIEAEEDARREKAVQRELESRREHELKLAKLKYATQPRYKSIERVVVSCVKALSLPVCIVVLGVLAARGVQSPPSLEKFINI